MLKYISKFTSNEATLMPFFVDVHIIKKILPSNSTLKFTGDYDVKMEKWKSIKINACSKKKLEKYHPRLRPAIQVIQGEHATVFQEIGLIFLKRQLRFVSCHKEQSHWIQQLKESLLICQLGHY